MKPATEDDIRDCVAVLDDVLRRTLQTVHPQAGKLICHPHNATSVSTDPIDGLTVHCDLFDMLHGGAYAVNTYYGEYLPAYPWAGFPTADLDPDP
ncbi:hypothetical protein AB4920_01240 [Bifidobacterium dentium]|uniref:hypothetical protein n=1 Tax=Bifidobacterium dentium TaxID=1689 RepID=UPI003D1782BA